MVLRMRVLAASIDSPESFFSLRDGNVDGGKELGIMTANQLSKDKLGGHVLDEDS